MEIRSSIVDITPKQPVELAGYTQGHQVYKQIDTALEANIIILSDDHTLLVLVGVDALFIGGSFYQLILNNLDRNAAHSKHIELCMYSSHTHTAPALDESKPILGEVNCEHFQHCALSISTAITDLCATQSPQQMGSMASGVADCHLSVYRRKLSLIRMPRSIVYRVQCAMNPNFDTPSIKQLKLGELRSADGEIKACIWSWPCHPITHSNPFAVSADFPGMVRDKLRKLYGNDQLAVIYLPGAAGDIRPRFIKKKIWRDYISQPFSSLFSDSNPALERDFNEKLINAIKQSVNSMQTAPIGTSPTIEVKKASVELDTLIEGFERVSCKSCVEPKRPTTDAGKPSEDNTNNSDENSLTIRQIHVGPFEITDVNAELCSPYNSYNESTGMSFFTGYSENSYGYLPADEQLDAGGYEVDEFFSYFSIKGKYLPLLNQQFRSLFNATKIER